MPSADRQTDGQMDRKMQCDCSNPLPTRCDKGNHRCCTGSDVADATDFLKGDHECSHFYRDHVEMPHDFARKKIQEVSYCLRNGAICIGCPQADVVTRAVPL